MAENIAVSLGFEGDMPFVASLTDELPHAQVHGPAWEQFTINMLNDIMDNYSPEKVEFVSTGESMNGLLMSTHDYLDYMHTVGWDSSAAYLTDELERRMGVFAHSNARNLTEYADKVEELPALIVLVDEWTDDVQIIHDLGRNMGLHLVCGAYTSIPSDVGGLAFVADVESFNKASVRHGGTTSLVKWQ